MSRYLSLLSPAAAIFALAGVTWAAGHPGEAIFVAVLGCVVAGAGALLAFLLRDLE